MKEGKRKTDWASLTQAPDGSVIVCMKDGDGACCVRFGSLEELKRAIHSRKIAVKKWAIAVSRSSCILKPLALPASDMNEAAKMIEFELPSLIPLPLSEVVYGCTSLAKQGNGLNILVCILKRKALEKILEPYRAIGIEPSRIILDSLAIHNWFDTTGVEVGVSIFAGANEYASEIKKQLGSVAVNPQIVSYEDGEYKSDCDGYAYEGILAAGLFELAVTSKLRHCNLLSQQSVRKFHQKALLLNYIVTGILSLVLVILLWGSLIGMNKRIERVSGKIESQIAPIEHVASGVESKRQRVKAIQRQLSGRGQIIQIFDEFYRYTPKTISISELRFVSRGGRINVEIKGQADVLSSAFEYTNAMSEAQLLDKIQITNAQQIPRPGGSIVEFKANCVIRDN